MTATAAPCPDGSPLKDAISPPGSCDWWSAACPLCDADFDRYASEAEVLGRLIIHLEDCSIISRDHDGVLPAARARLAQLEGAAPRAGGGPDRMVPLGTLPGLDFSTGTTTRVGRPAYRDYGTVILPGVQLDLAGIAAARALLDQAERDILSYQARVLAEAAADLPDACGWHGGEGDGGEFCEGCREAHAAKGAAS